MSVDVLSMPYSPHYQFEVGQWLLAQMAQYPPPPEVDQHYAAMYPSERAAALNAQHMMDQSTSNPFSQLNAPAFTKVEANGASHNIATPISHGTPEQQQHQAALEEQQRQQIQQVQQHIHSQTSHPHTPVALITHPIGPPSATTDIQKTNRLRKACDSCSIRKVKCDEAGPPCRACAALDIPCTFDRPSRRRGPPNRHAEAIKKRRLEEAQTGGSPTFSRTSSPSSPTHAAQALAAMSSQASNSQLSAESICPLEIIDLLIDDFFIYIHPLCPFPHEPSFREAWKRREDLTNKSFLALLASMIGALVSSFPRKPQQHLKMLKRESLFPNHLSLVTQCQQVCGLARGPGYLENDNLSVYDAATSYFLALMSTYTVRWRLGRLYFGECLTILRTLGLHKAGQQSYTNDRPEPNAVASNGTPFDGSRDQIVDNITLEMGRCIFWTMFVSIKTLQQLGASFGELVIPPPTPTEPYPPLPAEVDDFCIYPTHNEAQPDGLLPIMAGFNANVRVFCSYNGLATMEMSWGIDAVVDWERQKRVLHESLRRCRAAIDGLPAELKVFPDQGPFSQQNYVNGDGAFGVYGSPSLTPVQRNQVEQSPQERRRMQYEIQKANIYASSLSTRSYIVEKFHNLCDAHDRAKSVAGSLPGSPSTGITAAGIDGMLPRQTAPTSHFESIGDEMRNEREAIMKDLLVVLSKINQVNMEPNADSFTMKIRCIASTLLDVPNERKGQFALQAQEYLAAFLQILMQLERVSPTNRDPQRPDDEEAELRQWADLKDYQLKFQQQGGLLGMS